ncbi:MAG TPA: lipase [Ktedonobacteraceae bacterium]
MGFRPSRRQVLSSFLISAATGLAVPLVSTKEAFAHVYEQTRATTVQAPDFNPAIHIQPLGARQNTYPIMFVHGLGGFVTLDGLNYWGGFNNVLQNLGNNGYTALAAHIGPFSSNWDRACELYAAIKGGTVDYGQAHASKYGHARYGRTYPGVYSQWGETSSTGGVNKVHLIGHSMGSQTVRYLAQLLATGSAEEQAVTPSSELSPLFAGGKSSWLDGVVTLSGTHNGTTAMYAVQDVAPLPFLNEFIAVLAALQVQDSTLLGYDFMLDQWGLIRQPGESLSGFINRVENSNFATTTDNALTDLGLIGASVVNSLVRAQPEHYYFSVSTLSTFKELITGYQIPILDVTIPIPLYDISAFMGQYTQRSPIAVNSNWWANDSLVNTNTSQPGPSTDVIKPYNGSTPIRGEWNYLGIMNGYSHLDIIGFGLQSVTSWYDNLAALLASLPG